MKTPTLTRCSGSWEVTEVKRKRPILSQPRSSHLFCRLLASFRSVFLSLRLQLGSGHIVEFGLCVRLVAVYFGVAFPLGILQPFGGHLRACSQMCKCGPHTPTCLRASLTSLDSSTFRLFPPFSLFSSMTRAPSSSSLLPSASAFSGLPVSPAPSDASSFFDD